MNAGQEVGDAVPISGMLTTCSSLPIIGELSFRRVPL